MKRRLITLKKLEKFRRAKMRMCLLVLGCAFKKWTVGIILRNARGRNFILVISFF